MEPSSWKDFGTSCLFEVCCVCTTFWLYFMCRNRSPLHRTHPCMVSFPRLFGVGQISTVLLNNFVWWIKVVGSSYLCLFACSLLYFWMIVLPRPDVIRWFMCLWDLHFVRVYYLKRKISIDIAHSLRHSHLTKKGGGAWKSYRESGGGNFEVSLVTPVYEGTGILMCVRGWISNLWYIFAVLLHFWTYTEYCCPSSYFDIILHPIQTWQVDMKLSQRVWCLTLYVQRNKCATWLLSTAPRSSQDSGWQLPHVLPSCLEFSFFGQSSKFLIRRRKRSS